MSSLSPRDRANQAFTDVLLRMPHGTAQTVAAAMGISDGDLSTMKNKQLEGCLLLLAHLGLKVVPAENRCLTPTQFAFLTEQHQRMVVTQPSLVWGDA